MSLHKNQCGSNQKNEMNEGNNEKLKQKSIMYQSQSFASQDLYVDQNQCDSMLKDFPCQFFDQDFEGDVFQHKSELLHRKQDKNNFSQLMSNKQVSIVKKNFIFDVNTKKYEVSKYAGKYNLKKKKNSILKSYQQAFEPQQVKSEAKISEGRPLKRQSINRPFLEQAKIFFEIYHQTEQSGRPATNISLRRFAQETGYGYSTIYKLYRKWIDDPTFTKDANSGNNLTDSCLRSKSAVSQYRDNLMFKIIEHNPLLSSAEVAIIMSQDQNCHRADINGKVTKVHHRAIIRAFHANKIKKIRIRLISSKRNNQEDFERRRVYCQTFMRYLEQNEKIFFLDEMAVNKWVTRDKAWGRQGQCFANVMVNLKKESFLIVALMSNTGAIKYEVILGSSPSQKYQSILERMLAKPLQKYPNDPKVLIIHAAVGNESKQIMKNIAIQKSFKILLLPPFSSNLNPLECWFSQIKNSLKKEKFTNDRELIQATKKVINVDLKNACSSNYFAIAQKFLQKGLDRHNF